MGDNKFGKTHAKSILKFRELNKNLSFIYMIQIKMIDYMEKKFMGKQNFKNIFKNSLIGPLKSDIFRYCILYDQGGYYFDISRGCDVPT